MNLNGLELDNIRQFLSDNRQEMASTLCHLLSFPSIKEAPLPDKPYGQPCFLVIQEAGKIATDMGFSVRNYGNHCLEIGIPGSEISEALKVSLFAHLDVVAPGEGWRYPPFQATRWGNYINGRGAVDDKGPAVALLFALKYFESSHRLHNTRLRVILGCDEESGMHDMDHYLERADKPDIALVADDDFPVCHGEKGILCMELRFPLKSSSIIALEGGSNPSTVAGAARFVLGEGSGMMLNEEGALPEGIQMWRQGEIIILATSGKSAHASSPQEGRNALEILFSFVLSRQLFPEEDKEVFAFIASLLSDYLCTDTEIAFSDDVSGPLTCCGTMMKMEEGTLVLSLDIRYPVTDRSERILREVETLIRPVSGKCVITYDSAPSYMDAQNPLVRSLTGIYNDVSGSDTRPYTMGGGTYARKIPGAIGYGAGNPLEDKKFGPGFGAAHGPDEAVSMETLEQAVECYIRAVALLDRDHIASPALSEG